MQTAVDDFYPVTKSDVRQFNGVTTLHINDRPHTGLTFFFGRVVDSAPDIREFASAGINVFSGCFFPKLGDDGALDFGPMRERLEYTVAANPKLLILPRIGIHWLRPDHPWVRKYQDEMQVNIHRETGERKTDSCFSVSSAVWRDQVVPLLGQVVRWCEENFGDHILGYHLGAGAAGEWSYAWNPVVSDFSPPQVRAFRKWLRKRYGDDVEQLQRAWAQPSVEFDTADIPADRTCRNNSSSLFDPSRDRQLIDYMTFHSAAMADALVHNVRTVKQALVGMGRQKVCGAFYGYQFKNMNRPANFFNQGHFASDAVLSSPDVDFVCAPYCYSGREHGAMYLPQLVAGSVRLHGKLHWCEDDTFTHLSQRECGRSWCPDLATSVGVLRRNLMGLLREGGTAWYMDCGGNGGAPGTGGFGWYRDAGIMSAFAGMQALAERRLEDTDRSPVAQVAVFLSDASSSYLRQDESLVDSLIFRQMMEFGALGASFDTYRVEDLRHLERESWWGNYRLLVFLDALYVNASDREVIDRAAKRDGRTILWVYGAGLVTDNAFSPDAMEELTGLRVAVRRDGVSPYFAPFLGEPMLVNCMLTGSRIIYGTTRPIRPGLCGDDTRARVAGWLVNTGDPGMLERDMGSWRSVWSAAPAVPAAVLRHLARQAGVHIYVETGDQVLADRDYLAIHAGNDGDRSVRLPAICDVTDADTGQVVGRQVEKFTVSMTRGQTGIWKTEFPGRATTRMVGTGVGMVGVLAKTFALDEHKRALAGIMRNRAARMGTPDGRDVTQ